MEVINAIATNRNLLVIEDAAQAHGAIANSKFQIPNSQKAGNLSDAAALVSRKIWGTWRWWCHNYK
jgi:dTDP-4-amino-4,6-dideoxygalactose transaminase